MKTVNVEEATLDNCIKDAQRQRVVIIRGGKPVALIVGARGMDKEQLSLGSSGKFWKLITQRRSQKKLSRAELEEKLDTGRSSK